MLRSSPSTILVASSQRLSCKCLVFAFFGTFARTVAGISDHAGHRWIRRAKGVGHPSQRFGVKPWFSQYTCRRDLLDLQSEQQGLCCSFKPHGDFTCYSVCLYRVWHGNECAHLTYLCLVTCPNHSLEYSKALFQETWKYKVVERLERGEVLSLVKHATCYTRSVSSPLKVDS